MVSKLYSCISDSLNTFIPISHASNQKQTIEQKQTPPASALNSVNDRTTMVNIVWYPVSLNTINSDNL